MTDHRRAPLPSVLDRVEGVRPLDRVAAPVERLVRRVPEEVLRNLKGVDWLGHRLHPALVHLPIGSWVAASFMDATGQQDAARSLTVLGVAAAIPAAAAGWSDWSEMPQHLKRVGVVHAAANTLGLLLYSGSIAARYTGRVGLGQKLGLAALAAVGTGGAIGGDLVFRRAVGVDQAAVG
jgi:uncharacterized membrane protein